MNTTNLSIALACDRAGEECTMPREVVREAGWQPISTAPKDGTLVMLGARNGVWLGKYLPVYQSGFRPDNPWSSMLLNHDHMAERYTRPTHWMAIPAAPIALAQTKEQQHG